jgi:methylated-DNA-[protein]-cysteine S-methyltransferase
MIGLFTKDFGGVWFGVACDEQRVFGTSFADTVQNVLRYLLNYVPFDVPFETFPKPSPLAEKTFESMKSVYSGKGTTQTLPLAPEHLTAYNIKVLEACSMIPVGYVASYGALAKAAGGSSRSVGRVMAANPFAPLVPCHRVVRSDFSLGGYGGGLDVKAELLKREKRGYDLKQRIPVGNKSLLVVPVEVVFKKLKEKK